MDDFLRNSSRETCLIEYDKSTRKSLEKFTSKHFATEMDFKVSLKNRSNKLSCLLSTFSQETERKIQDFFFILISGEN